MSCGIYMKITHIKRLKKLYDRRGHVCSYAAPHTHPTVFSHFNKKMFPILMRKDIAWKKTELQKSNLKHKGSNLVQQNREILKLSSSKYKQWSIYVEVKKVTMKCIMKTSSFPCL